MTDEATDLEKRPIAADAQPPAPLSDSPAPDPPTPDLTGPEATASAAGANDGRAAKNGDAAGDSGAGEDSSESDDPRRRRAEAGGRALQGLSKACRQVFVLRFFDKASDEEIAARLGLSEDAIERHFNRAIEAVSEAMIAFDEEEARRAERQSD